MDNDLKCVMCLEFSPRPSQMFCTDAILFKHLHTVTFNVLIYVCHLYAQSVCNLIFFLYLEERGSLGRASCKTELQFAKHILQQKDQLSGTQQDLLLHLNVRILKELYKSCV